MSSPTTTGIMCMWRGTSDGKDAFVDVASKSTNLLAYNFVEVPVQDLKQYTPCSTFRKNGFQLVHHQSSVPRAVFLDADSEESRKLLQERYFAECCSLVKETTGAKEAITYVFRVRKEGTAIEDAANLKQNKHNGTVPTAHVDRDNATAPDRLRSSLGKDMADALLLKYRRFASVNIWRPISETVEKWPLCLIDHQAIPDWDYDTHMARLDVRNDDLYSDRGPKSHETILKFDSRYRYFYAANMTPAEILVFSGFHSEPNFAIPHCAFWDTATKQNALERSSIETRTWAFFDDENE